MFTCTKQLAEGLSQACSSNKLVMLCNSYTNGGEIKTKKLTSSRLVYVLQSLTRV